MNLPEFFISMLKKQYGEEQTKSILEGYNKQRKVTLRVNTLKTSIEEVKEQFLKKQIEWEEVAWSKEAIILKEANKEKIQTLRMYENGEIYLQSLSSMLPPILLNPKENTDILDMAAAPGGKTTQIAALTKNKAHITACEKNKIRLERLKYNVEKQGASSVYIMQEDSRNLSNFFSFDQILLDAPCSRKWNDKFTRQECRKKIYKRIFRKNNKASAKFAKKSTAHLKKRKRNGIFYLFDFIL